MLLMVLTARTIISIFELIIIKKEVEKNRYEEIDKYIEIILLIIIGESIINYTNNILIYIIPILVLLLLRKIIYHNKRVKNLFEKDPILLVKNGNIVYKNLFDNNYNIETLLTELKKKNIYNLKKIKYVFLSNSELYIIDENNENKNNEVIIIDNKVNKKKLKTIGISENYIKNILLKENIKLEDVSFGIYKNKKIYIIKNNLLK